MELTQEQEQMLLNAWNSNPSSPPSLKELTQLVYGGDFDGRSDEGKSVKLCLAKHNLRAKASSDDTKKTSSIVLTEEQKLYIVNNIATNTPVEIARVLFSNPALSNLNAETRIITYYVKSLDTKVIYGGKDTLSDVPDAQYEPPKTLDRALKKINEYVSFVNGVSNLTAQQKKSVERLIEYLHTYRFIRLMNSFESQLDRKSCEDAFIRYTYDKQDLTQEEIDQYISLAEEIVHGVGVKRRMEKLSKSLESVSDNNTEAQKYSMGLVEAIGKASTEYHQCRDRQKKLLDVLTQKRSERLDSNVRENASILNLVERWRNEESRKQLLRYGELEQSAVAKEVERLESVSELKARLMGFTKEQALYG